jgi:hypothetical protein
LDGEGHGDEVVARQREQSKEKGAGRKDEWFSPAKGILSGEHKRTIHGKHMKWTEDIAARVETGALADRCNLNFEPDEEEN